MSEMPICSVLQQDCLAMIRQCQMHSMARFILSKRFIVVAWDSLANTMVAFLFLCGVLARVSQHALQCLGVCGLQPNRGFDGDRVIATESKLEGTAYVMNRKPIKDVCLGVLVQGSTTRGHLKATGYSTYQARGFTRKAKTCTGQATTYKGQP